MKDYYRTNFYLEKRQKSRKIVAFLLTPLFLAILISCATEMAPGVRKLFDELSENVRDYNDLLRSNQFEKARLYVSEPLWSEFDTRARGVKIIECRLLSRDFRELNKGVKIVKVEIDYSIPPSSEIKTVPDNQRWNYLSPKKERKKIWMLTTPLPEFK